MAPFVCHSPCFLSNGSFSIDFTKSLRLGPLPLQHCRGSVLCLPDGFHWCRWLYCPSRPAKSLLSPSCSPLTQSTPMDLLRPTGENPVCRISNRFIHIGQITCVFHVLSLRWYFSLPSFWIYHKAFSGKRKTLIINIPIEKTNQSLIACKSRFPPRLPPSSCPCC